MGFFQHIEGVACVMVLNGVYVQADLYKRDGYLYAKSGGGFVRLNKDGSTTKAKLRLDHLSYDGELHVDALGRLCTDEVTASKALDNKAANQLLIGNVA